MSDVGYRDVQDFSFWDPAVTITGYFGQEFLKAFTGQFGNKTILYLTLNSENGNPVYRSTSIDIYDDCNAK